MLAGLVRSLGFWTLDLLKGRRIRKHYNDIKRIMRGGEVNEAALGRLLAHATATTEAYAPLVGKDISAFPVIDKNTVREREAAMRSSAYLDAPVYTASTSGSTGTPFEMVWNMDKKYRQTADVIYFNECAGHKLGKPYIYFRVWTEKNRKSTLTRWMQNLIPVDILYLDDKNLESIRRRLKRGGVNACIGYASTYRYLVRYLSAAGDKPKDFSVRSFITSSEVLDIEDQRLIKEVVGCKVIDRYANEENGFLAQSPDCSDEFSVNTASFFVEVLKEDSDEPCAVGELGRIVVTDLYNLALPMIRYDTGDLAVKAEEKGGWCTKLRAIQGRRADVIYDTAGRTLTTLVMGLYMKHFDKIYQYQFVQEGARKYTIRLNGAKPHYTDAEVLEFLGGILGEGADITVEHVSGIAALKSGKFKSTVCNYVYDPRDYE